MPRKRFVQLGGVLLEVGLDYEPELPAQTHHVMPDIAPYRSMQTGEIVNSRSKHRDILRQHGLIEVGNETKYMMKNREIKERIASDRRQVEARKRDIAQLLDQKRR